MASPQPELSRVLPRLKKDRIYKHINTFLHGKGSSLLMNILFETVVRHIYRDATSLCNALCVGLMSRAGMAYRE